MFRRHQSTLQQSVRLLLRNVAHPVAVVTAGNSVYHGATISSLTSIALYPHPLLAFALRLPSRLASTLNASEPDSTADLVINYLEEHQASTAQVFARGDVHVEPLDTVPYTLTKHGIPVLRDSLCAMSCKVISKGIPLHDLDFLNGSKTECTSDSGTNQLFIVRVVDVLKTPKEDGQRPLLYYNCDYARLRE